MAEDGLTSHDRERQQLEAIERFFEMRPVDRGHRLHWAKWRGTQEARQTEPERVEYAYPNKEQTACR